MDIFVNWTDEAQLTPLLRLGAGACAGIIAMSATYPMDMVRGRLTVQVKSMRNTLLDRDHLFGSETHI